MNPLINILFKLSAYVRPSHNILNLQREIFLSDEELNLKPLAFHSSVLKIASINQLLYRGYTKNKRNVVKWMLYWIWMMYCLAHLHGKCPLSPSPGKDFLFKYLIKYIYIILNGHTNSMVFIYSI